MFYWVNTFPGSNYWYLSTIRINSIQTWLNSLEQDEYRSYLVMIYLSREYK